MIIISLYPDYNDNKYCLLPELKLFILYKFK